MSAEDLSSLRDRVGQEVQEFQAAIEAFDEAAAVQLGINGTDLRCLEFLLQQGVMTPSHLRDALRITTGSVTALLDRMERLGYLTRSPDPRDRRKVVIRATPKATAMTWKIYGPIVEESAADLARYTAAELAVIADFLRRNKELYERNLVLVRSGT